MEKPKDALREYIERSEKRIVIDGVFNVRMSPELAQKFDAGKYETMIQEHAKCIDELIKINIKYPANAKPIFYLYIVPDENFVELLSYPYKERQGGGRPVDSYDLDGFNNAFGSSQNRIEYNGPIPVDEHHVNLIHEYAHLIQGQFGYGSQMFGEGFAEMIVWYALEYEKLIPSHLDAMKLLKKIYTANELLTSVAFSDVVSGKTCSFQPSYISSYLWVRAVVEHICKQYNLSKFDAIQKFLELYNYIHFDKQWFIMDLAKEIGMNVEKLLDSTDYQIAELNKIIKEVE